MIRRLLQRLLGPSGDVYVVRDHTTIVGVSARMQGAERIRAEHAIKRADERTGNNHAWPGWEIQRRHAYDDTTIENHELQDTE